MIKPNELRIGNWVDIPDDGQSTIIALDVSEASYKFIADEHGTGNSNYPRLYEELKPIPLTDEWFLKFGFELWESDEYSKRIDELGCLNIGRLKLTYQLVDLSSDLSANGYRSYDNRIEYVHQLQNLYFALTGEELVIKATK